MGAIAGPQFGENVPDPALDGFLRDRELHCNFLVGIPVRYQPQDLDFPSRQGGIRGVVGKLVRDFGGQNLFAGIDGADRVQQFLIQEVFQKVRPSAGS